MTFLDEGEAIEQLADSILRAGATLFKATKYLYVMTAENYYNCSVKDFIKVLLNNMYNADALRVFRISIESPTCAVLNTREYFSVLRQLIHSYAVRLPMLCRVNVHGQSMTDRQIDAVYRMVMDKGFTNETVSSPESFQDNLKAMRRGREEAPYNADWYRSYVYSAVPSLADLSNQNLLFLGTTDVLLTLYYLCLERDFETRIRSLVMSGQASGQG